MCSSDLSQLAADGFECSEFNIEPNRPRHDHAHPWHARLLVLEGQLTLATPEGEETFGPGSTCAVGANCTHAEVTGADGARGLLRKKSPN